MFLQIHERIMNRWPFLQKLQIWLSKKETLFIFQAQTSLTVNEAG